MLEKVFAARSHESTQEGQETLTPRKVDYDKPLTEIPPPPDRWNFVQHIISEESDSFSRGRRMVTRIDPHVRHSKIQEQEKQFLDAYDKWKEEAKELSFRRAVEILDRLRIFFPDLKYDKHDGINVISGNTFELIEADGSLYIVMRQEVCNLSFKLHPFRAGDTVELLKIFNSPVSFAK